MDTRRIHKQNKDLLPVKLTIADSRPLKKNRFVEKSTVEITLQGTLKFSAHIICVPLPHNPRIGDSINCCYVIEESIVSGTDLSKALFLLNEDETLPLSRAKKYILFQYINNEWQKKQSYATLKDIRSQTSPCHIPYNDIKSLWPVQDSLSQTSPQQPGHDTHSCRLGSKGAIGTTGTTKQCAGILQQREKAEQQNIARAARPSPTLQHQYNDDRQLKTLKVEDQSTVVSPTKGCGCKTGCTTKKCGCKTTKGCGCKTGCTTNRCRCKKEGLVCGPSCTCTNCENNQ